MADTIPLTPAVGEAHPTSGRVLTPIQLPAACTTCPATLTCDTIDSRLVVAGGGGGAGGPGNVDAAGGGGNADAAGDNASTVSSPAQGGVAGVLLVPSQGGPGEPVLPTLRIRTANPETAAS